MVQTYKLPHFNILVASGSQVLSLCSLKVSAGPLLTLSCVADASSKPKVECSVVTEFTDHICVTMDAELIMFLHDLVSAYLKEKEKGKIMNSRVTIFLHKCTVTSVKHVACVSALFAPRIFASRPGQKSPTAQQDESSSEKKEKEEGVNYTTVDWREFLCNTWHLEPTLR